MNSIIDSVSTKVSSLWKSVTESAVDVSNDYKNAVADLKAKATEFVRVYALLTQARKNATGAIASKIDALLSRGNTVRKTVEKITTTMDGGAAILPTNTLSGMRHSNLGFVFVLIPIVAAVTAMTAWLTDAYVVLQEVNSEELRINTAKELGLTGNEFTSFVNNKRDVGLNKWVLAGGIGAILLLGFLLYRGSRDGRT